jgi:hypothetical protein
MGEVPAVHFQLKLAGGALAVTFNDVTITSSTTLRVSTWGHIAISMENRYADEHQLVHNSGSTIRMYNNNF